MVVAEDDLVDDGGWVLLAEADRADPYCLWEVARCVVCVVAFARVKLGFERTGHSVLMLVLLLLLLLLCLLLCLLLLLLLTLELELLELLATVCVVCGRTSRRLLGDGGHLPGPTLVRLGLVPDLDMHLG